MSKIKTMVVYHCEMGKLQTKLNLRAKLLRLFIGQRKDCKGTFFQGIYWYDQKSLILFSWWHGFTVLILYITNSRPPIAAKILRTPLPVSDAMKMVVDTAKSSNAGPRFCFLLNLNWQQKFSFIVMVFFRIISYWKWILESKSFWRFCEYIVCIKIKLFNIHLTFNNT